MVLDSISNHYSFHFLSPQPTYKESSTFSNVISGLHAWKMIEFTSVTLVLRSKPKTFLLSGCHTLYLKMLQTHRIFQPFPLYTIQNIFHLQLIVRLQSRGSYLSTIITSIHMSRKIYPYHTLLLAKANQINDPKITTASHHKK